MLQLKNEDHKLVVYSDLDGTILNEKYSPDEVFPIIRQIAALNIPIVLCSGKTKVEIEYYKEQMGIRDPFIVENGAAIFLPKERFSLKNYWTRETEQYGIIEFGIPYSLIRRKFCELKVELDQGLVGFGDISVEEVSRETGLPIGLAEKSKRREYTEPFTFNGDLVGLCNAVRKKGLNLTAGGKYFHLMGNHSKGEAVLYLSEIYADQYGPLSTIGVGNEVNDLEMLAAVDLPFFVSSPDQMQRIWKEVANSVVQMLQKDFSMPS
jgi:mannosyl-3-phosphoglycerate phosphatase